MSLIAWSEALAAVTDGCRPAPEQWLFVGDALGAVPVGEITGRVASPAFDNAAMDGFAVRAEDTAGAAPGSPVQLPIAGQLKAGAADHAAAVSSGCVMRVDTGALVPPPLDAVLAQESATVMRRDGGEVLSLREPVEQGRNLRLEGEEYPAGARFDYAGARLRPGHIAHLSAAGVGDLRVRTPPPVGLLTTGGEVRPSRRRARSRGDSQREWVMACGVVR